MSQQQVSVAIIGGSGFYEYPGLKNAHMASISTPYGDVIGITVGEVGSSKIAFMPRHGSTHRLPPHKINYRANMWAFRELGVQKIIGLNAVGGIADDCDSEVFVVPDQIIDYTYGREHTFADLLSAEINHIDFTYPYDQNIRNVILDVLQGTGVQYVPSGVYGCTQGPRLETAVEVLKLQRDGCTIVGMTAMPEAALARELSIPYASICTVVNRAAGLGDGLISMAEIQAILDRANIQLRQILQAVIPALTVSP